MARRTTRRLPRSAPAEPARRRPTATRSATAAATGRRTCPARFPRDKPIRRNFPTRAEAVAWRAEAMVAVGRGELRAPTKITVREAADQLIAGMRDGSILNRSHARYKPSAIRSYERALRLRILPRFGPARLSAVTRPDLQRFVDDLIAAGRRGSTIRNTLDPSAGRLPPRRPLRRRRRRPVRRARRAARQPRRARPHPAVVARARAGRGAADGRRRGHPRAVRDRLPPRRQPRRAARVALGDVDLDAGAHGELPIARAWDDDEGEVRTKTQAGERHVPLFAETRRALVAHQLATRPRGR